MKPRLSFITLILLLAASPSGFTNSIEPGYDLLKVKSGKLKLNSFPGLVLPSKLKIDLKSKPLDKKKLGNADTKFKRKKVSPKDNAGKDSTMDIKLTALSLKSSVPVKIGNDFYDTKVKLSKTKVSKGKLEITGHEDTQGVGDFLIRDLNLFLQVMFIPVTGDDVGRITGDIDAGMMMSSGGTWSHESNSSYPTIPNFPAGNLFMQPFSLASSVLQLNSLVAASQQVPLPGSLLLVGGGLLLIGFARKRGDAR